MIWACFSIGDGVEAFADGERRACLHFDEGERIARGAR
jgi:hypothetical protein